METLSGSKPRSFCNGLFWIPGTFQTKNECFAIDLFVISFIIVAEVNNCSDFVAAAPSSSEDAPDRCAEQGNWVRLPNTFPRTELVLDSVAVSVKYLFFLCKQVTGRL